MGSAARQRSGAVATGATTAVAPVPLGAARPAWRALVMPRQLSTFTALGAIVSLALFLRLFGLDGFVTFYPDTYGQLRAADNLASGSFPITYLYPPGIAVFLAPVFVLFPRTVLTLQVTVLAAGMALVVLAYHATMAMTGDRRAALMHATAVAVTSIFVFHSRVALFDVINTLLIVTSFLLAPWVVRRAPAALVAYGVLLFATITVRYTNPVVLPALFLASMPLRDGLPSWRRAWSHLRSRPVVLVALVVLALGVAYVATTSESLTRFGNGESGSIIDVAGYPVRLVQYALASLTGYGEQVLGPSLFVAPAVLPLVVAGARRLWRTDRRSAMALFCLMLTWAPVHAVYLDFWSRYAMPLLFFTLMLGALGVVSVLEWMRTLQVASQRMALAGGMALALTLFVGQQAAQDILVLQWPDTAARNSEEAYEQIRTVLRTLDGPSSVLVSSQALAVDRANPEMTTFDLLLHSERNGINDASVEDLLAYVREQQASGKTVYYHYTGYEEKSSHLKKYELSFRAYLGALDREFSLREIVRASERPQRLYLIESAPTSP